MITVQVFQINDNFGNQYYLPYGAGVLVQYALHSESVRNNCKFKDPIYCRASVDDIVKQIGTVDVLGVSSYIWNWNISTVIGKRIRESNPECLIVYGGPQVPDNSDHFFKENPFIDMVVHGEGEQAFLEILEALIHKKDISSIPSTCYYNRAENKIYHNKKRPRMKNLTALPSPYLNDYFSGLIKNNPDVEWMAMWETNRGCPFKCTFCDWGSATASKVTEMEWQRLIDELNWFVDNKIKFILCCDANFGIRPRDLDLAKEIAKSKRLHQYPQSFKTCFTKNSTQTIFEIAKIFHEAEMQRGGFFVHAESPRTHPKSRQAREY